MDDWDGLWVGEVVEHTVQRKVEDLNFRCLEVAAVGFGSLLDQLEVLGEVNWRFRIKSKSRFHLWFQRAYATAEITTHDSATFHTTLRLGHEHF